jgi:uncharacterized protein (DUF1697 family)
MFPAAAGTVRRPRQGQGNIAAMNAKRYIALLRGINVGRAKRIAMADLRKLVEELGYTDVRSVLNSGNVVFTGPAKPQDRVAAEIEEALVLKVGVAARTLVLDAGELDAIVAANPLLDRAGDHSRLIVFILAGGASRDAIAALCAQDWHPGAVGLGERAAYVWCPDGILDSPAAAALGKQLGDGTTSRNWSTVLKLHALTRDAATS